MFFKLLRLSENVTLVDSYAQVRGFLCILSNLVPPKAASAHHAFKGLVGFPVWDMRLPRYTGCLAWVPGYPWYPGRGTMYRVAAAGAAGVPRVGFRPGYAPMRNGIMMHTAYPGMHTMSQTAGGTRGYAS